MTHDVCFLKKNYWEDLNPSSPHLELEGHTIELGYNVI